MRQYETVWNEIKINKTLRLSSPRPFHKRIIKAVVKEKDMDLGYKLECSESYPPTYALLRSKREGAIITFTLTLKPLITLDSV